MKVRAAVAYQAKAPLVLETIDVEGPKEGEVLVEVKATGICHTDEYTLSGADPEGQFPVVLGHEGVYSSVWQMPVAFTSTRTSPSFGPSRSIISSVSGAFA